MYVKQLDYETALDNNDHVALDFKFMGLFALLIVLNAPIGVKNLAPNIFSNHLGTCFEGT